MLIGASEERSTKFGSDKEDLIRKACEYLSRNKDSLSSLLINCLSYLFGAIFQYLRRYPDASILRSHIFHRSRQHIIKSVG